MKITSDNKLIISGSQDNSIKVFDFDTKREVHHFQNAHQRSITSVAITADNRFIISGSHDKSLKVFDLQTKQEVHYFKNAHQGFINTVVVTSDNKFVISGSSDQSLKVFALDVTQEVHHFQKAQQSNFFTSSQIWIPLIGSITSVAISSDNKFIISGSHDRSIKIFDFHTKEEIHHFQKVHLHKRISHR